MYIILHLFSSKNWDKVFAYAHLNRLQIHFTYLSGTLPFSAPYLSGFDKSKMIPCRVVNKKKYFKYLI